MLIGIDLGTTNSLAACFSDGKVCLIPNALGKMLTPSVVAVDEKGQVLIGETAKEYGYLHPEARARLFKRSMGTDKTYELSGMTFRSEELSSLILRSLKEDAEAYLHQTVDEAIISVPAYFNDHQRKATKEAGELAGLKVPRIINEPTASAIAYGVGEKGNSECCMVLDLGGGTFDVTVLEYYRDIMEVYAIAGDNSLGGEDFTMRLTEMFMDRCGLKHLSDLKTLSDIYKAAEAAKCNFEKQSEVLIRVKIDGDFHEENFTINEFEEACLPLLEKLRKPIEKSLKDAKISLNDLDRIILAGGATRLPIVRNYIKRMTGIYPEFSVDPDTSIAQGAALVCAMKERREEIEEVILTDVCPFTLGTEVLSFEGAFLDELRYLPIIERNTIIPVSRTQTVVTSEDDQKMVTVKILQGESRIPSANLLIGSVSVDVPPAPKGQEAIDITYTYDVNSLLEVKVKVLSTGLEKTVIIQDEDKRISEEEAQKRLEKLAYLKRNPREDEENLYTLMKARRVIEERDADDTVELEEALGSFERALDEGTRLEADKRRKEVLSLIEEIEAMNMPSFLS